MRRIMTFDCVGAPCAATLDDAAGAVGVLIVSGGNEVRVGSFRGMARLGTDLAAGGIPVFRYDRRGVGDSGGDNLGFEASGPDMAAALAAFRAACPHLSHVIAYGNCDAATALVVHAPDGLAARVLSNPWVVPVDTNAQAPAAARAYYAQRLRDPRAWLKLLRGRVNLRDTADSLHAAAAGPTTTPLAARFAQGLERMTGPVTILLSEHDGTAIAFLDQWQAAVFDAYRNTVTVRVLPSASHALAPAPDHAALLDTLRRVAASVLA